MRRVAAAALLIACGSSGSDVDAGHDAARDRADSAAVDAARRDAASTDAARTDAEVDAGADAGTDVGAPPDSAPRDAGATDAAVPRDAAGCTPGERFTESCDGEGNDVTWRCNDRRELVVESRVFGCTTTSEPGAGTRVCPGQIFTRSCWPIADGRARVDWRCDGSTTASNSRFVEVDQDYCTASSGPEAGTNFCPGEVILRDGCPSGSRRYFICPEDAERGSSFAFASDAACGEPGVWEPIHRGVDFRRWFEGGQRYRAVRIDLCDASLRIAATETADRRQRTSSWAASQRWMIAAVNGGFFPPGNPSRPDGIAYGGGSEWPDSANTGARGFVAFGPGQTWYSEVAFAGPAEDLTPWIEEGVSHDFVMIRAGAVQSAPPTDRRARTGLGFPIDARTLYFLTVDEVGGSAGMSVSEFAAAFGRIFPDAWSAVRLDGGGSSTLWTHAHGVANRPSDGRERTVANHLGVFIEGGLRGYNCPR
ncbi:MAG: phosphodiester glycosidase family protein [Myxococcota bacterium]